MTRRAWVATIAVVAVAIAATIAAVVVAASDGDRDVRGPQAMTQQQFDMGRGDGFGFGPGGRMGVQDAEGWWSPAGLPWLAAGLLLGLGATMLAWRPWKERSEAAVVTGAGGAAVSGASPPVAEQWAQWHRDVHAADETAVTDVTGEPVQGAANDGAAAGEAQPQPAQRADDTAPPADETAPRTEPDKQG